RAAAALARADHARALAALAPTLRAREPALPSLLLAILAQASHPLRASPERQAAVQPLLQKAARLHPDAWYPALYRARIALARGQVATATRRLRRAAKRWPHSVTVALALHDVLVGRGWHDSASRVLQRLGRLAPDLPAVLRARLMHAERGAHYTDALQLARHLRRIDARNLDGLRLLLAARRWSAARQELERLDPFIPPQGRRELDVQRLALARGQGDWQAAARHLQRLLTAAPQHSPWYLGLGDLALAQGRRPAALALWRRGLIRQPGALGKLHPVAHAIAGLGALSAERFDAGRVIQAFEARQLPEDDAQVMVLDATTVQLFSDGSALELTHNIYRLQSQEAVDEQGEFRIPDGAEMLQLHTIKADGRRLEPEHIAGKATLSLPQLEPGDYVEIEYLRHHRSPPAFPAGYLGDRFYFQTLGVPLHFSRLRLLSAPQVEITVDARGPAPRVQVQRRDGLLVRTWQVEHSPAAQSEPGSVDPREHLPSVRLGWRVRRVDLFASIRNLLISRDPYDDAAARLVRRLLRGKTTLHAKARHLYRWTLKHIEHRGDMFALAPAMLAARRGHRSRVLHYLYKLAGLPSALWLSADLFSPPKPGLLPDETRFNHLLVAVGTGQTERVLAPEWRYLPYGDLPPALRRQPAWELSAAMPEHRLPDSGPAADRHRIAATLHLGDNATATLEVRERLHGYPAWLWRTQLSQSS
ncbi:MAG: tetratricopeptide repeat protein, partial [Polyangiales bacterium]